MVTNSIVNFIKQGLCYNFELTLRTIDNFAQNKKALDARQIFEA